VVGPGFTRDLTTASIGLEPGNGATLTVNGRMNAQGVMSTTVNTTNYGIVISAATARAQAGRSS